MRQSQMACEAGNWQFPLLTIPRDFPSDISPYPTHLGLELGVGLVGLGLG